MSGFAKTYAHNVLIGLDDLGAVVFFNRNDVSISGLCRLAQKGELDRVKAGPWQIWVLLRLAVMLDWIRANHCEAARLGDIDRAKSTITILS